MNNTSVMVFMLEFVRIKFLRGSLRDTNFKKETEIL